MTMFVYHRPPAFADSDAAGMVHFSRLACYVEEAEHAFLRDAGFPVDLDDESALLWPRVAFSAEYFAPVSPWRDATVHLSRAEIGKSSVDWEWELFSGDRLAARGRMKTVCCARGEKGPAPTPLPTGLRERLSNGC